MPLLAAAAALAVVAAATATATSSPDSIQYHRYIVLGAGPGGLQIAHYLDTAGRDYVVLDKAAEAGSFFRRFPRWRELISINKAWTGKPDLEYNQRHDWNSLLNDPSPSSPLSFDLYNRTRVACPTVDEHGRMVTVPAAEAAALNLTCATTHYSTTHPQFVVDDIPHRMLVKHWTSKYYPHADVMADYLNHWASDKAQRGVIKANSAATRRVGVPLRIHFNTPVVRIARPHNYTDMTPIQTALAVARGVPRFWLYTGNGTVYACTYLIVAGGFQIPNPALGVNVAQMADTYWNHSTDLSRYVNKHVLLIGRGNAAFEVANSVLEVAASVHLVGQGNKRVRLAWETHYPGDVRMVHGKLLETYLLKSMDAMAEVPFEEMYIERNNATGKLRVSDPHTPCEYDTLGREVSRCFWRKEFDIIISCPGFRFDASLFDPPCRPEPYANKKHPNITSKYESTNVPGLFFAGSLMHAHDFKKSSGGFVHGFRYLIRSLHRILEEEEMANANALALYDAGKLTGRVAPDPVVEAVAAPAATITATAVVTGGGGGGGPRQPPFTSWPRTYIRGLRALAHHILRRINNAASIYQMFGGVGDVIVLPPVHRRQTEHFLGTGIHAALHDPAGFVDPTIPTDYLVQQPLNLPNDLTIDHARLRSDETLDGMCRSVMFEDVPVKLAGEKAALWQRQFVAFAKTHGIPVGDPATDGVSTSSGGGVEFLVLTMEFGSKSSSNPRPVDPNDRMAAHRAAQEWARDPFSLNRANVSLWDAQESHFLHPVLRYFNSALDPARTTMECHIIEDFHVNWTNHISHVLPLTRFLQDVGGRRAVAAMEVANKVAEVAASTAHEPREMRSTARAAAIRSTLARVWLDERKSDDHTTTILQLMTVEDAVLWFGGHPFPAKEGWDKLLTVNATDYILYNGPRMVLTHWYDVIPIPPTPEEEEITRRLRHQMRHGGDDDELLNQVRRGQKYPGLKLTAEQQEQKRQNEEYLTNFYRQTTSSVPGSVIIAVNARGGLARALADLYGVVGLPTFRIIDSYRGVVDLERKNFDAVPRQLAELLSTHWEAKEAFERGDDRMLFRGFTLEMLRHEAPGPHEKMAHRARMNRGEEAGPDPFAHEPDEMTRVHTFQSGEGQGGTRRPGGGGGKPPKRAGRTRRRRRLNERGEEDDYSILGGEGGGGDEGGYSFEEEEDGGRGAARPRQPASRKRPSSSGGGGSRASRRQAPPMNQVG